MLFEELSESYGFDELETRRINQDELENFFGLSRMRNYNNSHPDCSLFKATYRGIVVNQMLETKGTGNCEADSTQTIVNVEDFGKLKLTRNADPPAKFDKIYTNSRMEIFEIPRVHNIVYSAKWLTGAILHDNCSNNLKQTDQTSSLLSQLKHENTTEVSDHLVKHISMISGMFDQLFDKFLEESTEGVMRKIENQIEFKYIDSFLCENCCVAVTHKYIVLRIRSKIKSMNEEAKLLRKTKRKAKKSAEVSKARKLNIE